MHYLHKILVHIPDTCANKNDRESLIDAIRSYAESVTDSFYEQAFDWRETVTAGRWDDEYPENVLLASEDPERFVQEMEDVIAQQKQEIDYLLAQLREKVGTDLYSITDGLWKRRSVFTGEADPSEALAPYNLHCLADFLYGEYRCDSCFYNTRSYTARLYAADIDAVKETPDDWALVMFDYHY